MLALYRQGRQGDALEAYRRARTELRDGLGVDPGPRLRELEAQVLAQDPGSLVVSAPARQPARTRVSPATTRRTPDCSSVGNDWWRSWSPASSTNASSSWSARPARASPRSYGRVWSRRWQRGAARLGCLAGGRDGAGNRAARGYQAALADPPAVLVVDQAEEALLADDGAQLTPFGDRLLDAVGDGIRVVLVVRADFFGLLSKHPVLARRAGPATVLVGPPDERELRRIIIEPAARVGLRVDPRSSTWPWPRSGIVQGDCRSYPPRWSAPGSTARATRCRSPRTTPAAEWRRRWSASAKRRGPRSTTTHSGRRAAGCCCAWR